MKELISLHNHSTYSDGKNTQEEMVKAAIDAGFTTLGFSDHSYVRFDHECGMPRDAEAEYKKEIARLKEKYKDKIEVLCGIELDLYTEGDVEGFDYVIISNHYVKCGDEYVIADYRGEKGAKVLKGAADRYFNGDIYALIERYFDEFAKGPRATIHKPSPLGRVDATRQQDTELTASKPSPLGRVDADRQPGGVIPSTLIIGHLDIISASNDLAPFFDPAHPRYIAAWKAAADKLLEITTTFEINYSDVLRGSKVQPYPAEDIREYILSKGGRFIITGDCHSTEKLTAFAQFLKK